MKLTQTKIEEIALSVLGAEGLRLIKELKDKENISEFSLANRIKRDIKLVRRMLYKLNNYNLVYSTRKKDKQKGWYIYYWTLIPENIKFLYLKNKKLLLQKLKVQAEQEQTEQFYSCPKKCIRLDFDQSLDFEFHCPECGELISLDHDLSYTQELQKKISEIEKEIKSEEKITPQIIPKNRQKKKKIKKQPTDKKTKEAPVSKTKPLKIKGTRTPVKIKKKSAKPNLNINKKLERKNPKKTETLRK